MSNIGVISLFLKIFFRYLLLKTCQAFAKFKQTKNILIDFEFVHIYIINKLMKANTFTKTFYRRNFKIG